MNVPDHKTLVAFAKANVAAWQRIPKVVEECKAQFGEDATDEGLAWFENALRSMAGGEEMYQASQRFLADHPED